MLGRVRARSERLDATLCLLIAICIDKEGPCSHNIFAASTLKIGFVDRHKDANTPLRRVERLHLRPQLVERPMKNFGVAASAIAEELKGKSARLGIKTGKEVSRHVLVVR